MNKRIGPWIVALVLSVGAIAAQSAPRTVAKVNGKTISQNDLLKELEAQQGRQVLDYLITNMVIGQEAAKKNIKINDADVDGLLRYREEQMGGSAELESMLKRQGRTLAQIKDQLRLVLTVSRLMFTEKDMQDYFEQNHATQFDVPTQAEYWRLIVKTKDEAEKLRKRIVDDKEDFAKLAKQLSIDDATKADGGKMGTPALEGRMPKEMDEFLFKNAKPGDVSQPIESSWPKGWMLIKLEKTTPGKPASYEKDRWVVWDRMWQMKGADAMKLVNGLKADAKVEILNPQYKSLLDDYKALKQPALPPGGVEPPVGPSEGNPPPPPPPG